MTKTVPRGKITPPRVFFYAKKGDVKKGGCAVLPHPTETFVCVKRKCAKSGAGANGDRAAGSFFCGAGVGMEKREEKRARGGNGGCGRKDAVRGKKTAHGRAREKTPRRAFFCLRERGVGKKVRVQKGSTDGRGKTTALRLFLSV